MTSELTNSIISELRRGTLIMLTLCKLKKPMYGYHLIKELEECGLRVEANTLYPLMRRLEQQGLLCSSWDTSMGKPRKYYQTTEQGQQVYAETAILWKEYTQKINFVLEEANDDSK